MNDQSNSDSLIEETVADSEDSFFDSLDKDVNGMINDGTDTGDATPQQDAQPVKDQGSQVETELERMKKRYSDSSREAQKMASQLNQLKPFVPVLDAIKNDKGLVNHIKGYYEGGKQTDLKAGLPDDFEFDLDDAINDPKSGSRQVFDKLIQQQVNAKAKEITQTELSKVRQAEFQARQNLEVSDFMRRHDMDDTDFKLFLEDNKAIYQKGDTLEDVYNRRNGMHQNVAKQTKEDMLTQMKNVRDIPVSQSSSNNAGKVSSPDSQLFDALLKTDGSLDNMFNE